MKSRHIPYSIIFIMLGVLSTIWFLIRVIPKPSRAAYPCMQATAPFMSGFVLWLLSFGGGIYAIRRFFISMAKARFQLAAFFFLLAVLFAMTYNYQQAGNALAKESVTFGEFPPNQPIGEAQGIFPGRVTWIWNPDATNELCTNTSNQNGVIDEGDDGWFMAHNNNYPLINNMTGELMKSLTGQNTTADAWQAVFTYFNEKNGNGSRPYITGEKIFIKINATTVHGTPGIRYYEDLSRNDDTSVNEFAAETNPYIVLSILHQLVEEAGVPQNMIYVGDPARNIYKEFYDLWKQDFPNVNYLGNDLLHPELDLAALGRHPVEVTDEKKVFYADEGNVMTDAVDDGLFRIFEEMDYLINIPTLKAHSTAGITLAAKNHFGSFTRYWAVHLHSGLFDGVDDPQRLGYGLYRVQTDIMMHNLLSGKNLLILVDGLYPGADATSVAEKWQSIPFNGDWCSSLFASLDPVAIESVCHDFLRTEYNGPTISESRPNWDGVDDYLHQAADSSLWPEGIVYDPDADNILIPSLGVHEHWNDSLNREYTRNLGTGNGIELIKVHELISSIPAYPLNDIVTVYPNPACGFVTIKNTLNSKVNYMILNQTGTSIKSGSLGPHEKKAVNLESFKAGLYYLHLAPGQRKYVKKILVGC